MCIGVLSTCIQCPQRSEKSVVSSGTGVKDDFDHLVVARNWKVLWKSNTFS